MTNQLTEQQRDLLQYANLAKQMSEDVYIQDTSIQYAGWELEFTNKYIPSNTGLYFAIYTNGDTAFVVTRGTEITDKNDLINDWKMLTNNVSPQFNEFNELYENNIVLRDALQGKRVIAVGNSSGGSLSEAAAAKYGWEAITINSYGTQPWIGQLKDENGNPISSNPADYTDRIINFVSGNDLVGCAGKHIGQNIYLDGALVRIAA